jgi:hypothetical protein
MGGDKNIKRSQMAEWGEMASHPKKIVIFITENIWKELLNFLITDLWKTQSLISPDTVCDKHNWTPHHLIYSIFKLGRGFTSNLKSGQPQSKNLSSGHDHGIYSDKECVSYK